jgi:DNA polymerase I-like protein with 3'-5' exonuclease and polymerase domains
MLLQIHDEIVFSIKTDKIDYYSPKIIEIMEAHPEFPIKLKVESKLWK